MKSTNSVAEAPKDNEKIQINKTHAGWLTLGGLVVFWLTSGFMSAIGVVMMCWALFFVYRAVRYKTARVVSLPLALMLFIVGGLVMPEASTDKKDSTSSSVAITDTAKKQRAIDEENMRKQQQELARIEKERKLAEAKENERKEGLAQQLAPTGELYQVTSITDGDTIKVKIGDTTETVRFIGMDTPETKDPRKPVQCFGREASSKMQSYVQSKRVRLASDQSQGDRDKYGRLLRYVFTEDGANVAYEMILGGYAHEYTYNLPYKYQSQFKQAQSTAREAGSGLWSQNTCNGITNQTHPPKAAPAPKPAPAPSPAPQSSSVYYKNCTAARNAGAAPVHQGQPGYGTHLDRDGDGIGCE